MERLMAHIFIKERYFWLEIGDLPGFQPECFCHIPRIVKNHV